MFNHLDRMQGRNLGNDENKQIEFAIEEAANEWEEKELDRD